MFGIRHNMARILTAISSLLVVGTLQGCSSIMGDGEMREMTIREALQEGKAVVVATHSRWTNNMWVDINNPNNRFVLANSSNLKKSEALGSFQVKIIEPGTYAYAQMTAQWDDAPLQINAGASGITSSSLGRIEITNTTRSYQEPYTEQVWQEAQGYYQYVNPTGHPGTQAIPIWTQTQSEGYYNVTRYRTRYVDVVQQNVILPTVDQINQPYLPSITVEPGDFVYVDLPVVNPGINNAMIKHSLCTQVQNGTFSCPIQELRVLFYANKDKHMATLKKTLEDKKFAPDWIDRLQYLQAFAPSTQLDKIGTYVLGEINNEEGFTELVIKPLR